MCIYMWGSVGLYMWVQCPWRSKEGTGSPEPTATGSSEQSDMDTRNQTQAFWRAACACEYWAISPALDITTLSKDILGLGI